MIEILIKSVHIWNYRSIVNETINVNNLNVFVGLNDAGKSNILKALNLFFNGESDYNTGFNFETDFTHLYSAESKKAKEIKIEIVFEVPKNFKENGQIKWTKTWGQEGLRDDIVLNSKGQRPSERSRTSCVLRRIRFRYVPAVKSASYYKVLLEELYKTVSTSDSSPLKLATQNFSQALKDYTIELSNSVLEQLNMQSVLSIPNNFTDIFKALSFQTQTQNGTIEVPLTSRGDGIQALHIPIILKYISDEDYRLNSRGSVKINTIWGFEEPENGLELLRAFQIANDFEKYSTDIQIFITTHSPAFYMKKGNDGVKVYYVSKEKNNEITVIDEKIETNELSENIGLMPIVAPYIAKQKEALEELEKEIKNQRKIFLKNPFVDAPTILVEGKSDLEYITLAIQYLSPSLTSLLQKEHLRIITNEVDGAGTSLLKDWAYAWIYSHMKNKLLVLFDKDDAGINCRKEILDSPIYSLSNNKVKLQHLIPSPEIIELFKCQVHLQFEIEHLLCPKFWEVLIKEKMTMMKTGHQIYSMIKKDFSPAMSINDIIDSMVPNKSLANTILLYDPHPDKKMEICKLAKENYKNNMLDLLIGFKPTIQMLEKEFI